PAIDPITGQQVGLRELQFLSLDVNAINNISVLAGLTDLQALSLDHNAITDLTPLQGLSHLRFLSLAHQQILDIRPLAGLDNLQVLDLHDNNISDISALTGERLVDNGDNGYHEAGTGWQGNLHPNTELFQGDYRFHTAVADTSTAQAVWEF